MDKNIYDWFRKERPLPLLKLFSRSTLPANLTSFEEVTLEILEKTNMQKVILSHNHVIVCDNNAQTRSYYGFAQSDFLGYTYWHMG